MSHRTSIAALLLAAAACSSEPEPAKDRWDLTTCADGTTIPGIDVSTYQATVDWPTVRASGVRFAYIRVSDGLGYPDDQFAANWTNARAAGVVRGVYQFFRPTQDPIAQADYLLAHMGTLEPDDLPPAIDVETANGATQAEVTAAIHAWVDHIQAATGRAPVFYVGKYSWPTLANSDDFAAYPLWVPQWGPVCPDIPSPWIRWSFFQTSATGSVPGITGAVDLDVFNGTIDDLTAFAGERTVCGDAACTAGETVVNCPGDCLPCATIPAAGRVVDDSEFCFTTGGDPVYIRHVSGAGFANSLQWTHTTALAAPSNYGDWALTFDQSGLYRLEAYTAAPYAQSTKAVYVVQHAGTTDSFQIDQTAVDGWSLLGDVPFAAGGDQSVRVNDNTGEPGSANVQLAFDALRVTRLDLPPPGTPDAGPPAGGVDAGAPPEREDAGCTITITSSSSSSSRTARLPSALLLLAVSFSLVLRRRRAS